MAMFIPRSLDPEERFVVYHWIGGWDGVGPVEGRTLDLLDHKHSRYTDCAIPDTINKCVSGWEFGRRRSVSLLSHMTLTLIWIKLRTVSFRASGIPACVAPKINCRPSPPKCGTALVAQRVAYTSVAWCHIKDLDILMSLDRSRRLCSFLIWSWDNLFNLDGFNLLPLHDNGAFTISQKWSYKIVPSTSSIL
jgi:hypothetical protein